MEQQQLLQTQRMGGGGAADAAAAIASALDEPLFTVGSRYRPDAVFSATAALLLADFFAVPLGLDNGGGTADAREMGAAAPVVAAATTGDAVARDAALPKRLGGELSPTAWSLTICGDFLAMADIQIQWW